MTTINGNPNFGRATYHAPVIGVQNVASPGVTREPGRRADVGVLTVLTAEIRAVQGVLRDLHDYRSRRLPAGPLAHEAWLPGVDGGRVRVAAIQTLARGTESAALAHRLLTDEYAPAVVLLVGIAGGVGRDVRVGDVVVADEVIAYDNRREHAGGTARRGWSQTVAAPLGHRLHEFTAAVRAEQVSPEGVPFRIHRGPIGSGNAVITDARSAIREWLTTFHERVLAVETEAAGVAQAFHESGTPAGAPPSQDRGGWLTVRGISDTADDGKDRGSVAANDERRDCASRHAALTMGLLLPHLGS